MQTPTPPPSLDEHVTPDAETDANTPSSAAVEITSSAVEAVGESAPSAGRAVAKVTAGIGVLHLLKVIVGFVTQPLIAHRFGLTSLADVYSVSQDIVSSLWLIFEKILNPSVLPLFSHSMKDEGEERAWRFASAAICLTLLALIIVTPIAWLGMPFIVNVYSQKSDAEQRALTVAISRLLLAGLWSLGLSSLTYVLLNGYKRFAAAALGDTFWRLGIMIAAMAAVALHMDPLHTLYVVSYGFILGSLLKLLPQVIALRAKWHFFKPNFSLQDPLIKRMFWLAVPLLIGVVTSESRDIFSKWLADSPLIHIEGSRAALKFSRTIGNNLVNIFPYALSIGIFPYLADMARGKDRQPFTDTLLGALRVCFFVFVPLTAILIALRMPLLRAVWESGNFTSKDTIMIIAPFVAYNLGLVGFACENILNQSFYAKTQPWVPTVIGLGTTAFFCVSGWVGVQWLGFGLAALAGAESLQKTLKCLIMWGILRPQLGDIKTKENLAFLGKILVGSIVAAGVAMVVYRIAGPSVTAEHFSKIRGLLAVLISGIIAVLSFTLACLLMKVREAEHMAQFGRRLVRR